MILERPWVRLRTGTGGWRAIGSTCCECQMAELAALARRSGWQITDSMPWPLLGSAIGPSTIKIDHTP